MDRLKAQTTQALLEVASHGDQATRSLLPHVYDELRSLARRYIRGERPGHTLQPTDLVHEAYLRMVNIDQIDIRGRTHFFALAARQMRRVLVDHARARSSDKRGGGVPRVTLDDRLALETARPEDTIALDEALSSLAELDPRRSTVAELRLFGGLKTSEIAIEVGVSERTVRDDWRFAQAWLSRALGLQAAGS